ncbi:MAG: PEP-CTERM sorting domain-containing protein [Planctomycetes bacterium]|nr:PEP-CTERM sorting domain-containing protein [Planctomycetota bacterium]
MRQLKGLCVSTAIVLTILGSLPSRACAEVTPVGQFTGDYSEGWEDFTPYRTSPYYTYLPNGQAVLGGAGTISADTTDVMIVYRPGTTSTFRIGTSGQPPYGVAQVAEGFQGLGINSPDALITLEFSAPVCDFGAFWGASTQGSPATITVDFYGPADQHLGTEQFSYNRSAFADGLLEWHGWHSDSPIASLTFSSEYLITDGLQANPVPEPATMGMLALSLSALLVRRRRRLSLVLIPLLALSVAPPVLATSTYTVTSLGTLPDGGSRAHAINEQGEIVGHAGGYEHPFYWDGTAMHDLGTFGGKYGQADGINDTGTVVGYAGDSDETWRAFSWTSGSGLVDLGSLSRYGSQARDVNNAGQIVGNAHYSYSSWHAFLWQDNVMIDLDDSDSGRSIAYAINEAGQVVGSDDGVAVMWHNGSRVEIGRFGLASAEAWDVNDHGQVAVQAANYNQSIRRSFLWENGVEQDLGTLGGDRVYAKGINNLSQVVGQAQTVGNALLHGWIWEDGTMTDLNDLVPQEWSGLILDASGINDRGQICATAWTSESHRSVRAVLLDPVPEPATMGLLTLGLSAMAARRGRRQRQ